MTLNERALIHGRAALASPDAEERIGRMSWSGFFDVWEGRVTNKDLGVGLYDDGSLDGETIYAAIDLATVMYAQDVAEGRHT